MARLLRLPAAANTDKIVLPFGGLSAAQSAAKGPFVHWAKQRRPPFCAASNPGWNRLLFMLGLASLPMQVWAAPKGLSEALARAHDIIEAANVHSCGRGGEEVPDDMGPAPNPWARMVGQVQAESLREVYGTDTPTQSPDLVSHLQGTAVPLPRFQQEPTPTEGDHLATPQPSTSPRETSSRPLRSPDLDAAEFETAGPGIALDVPVLLAAAGYRLVHSTAGVSFPSRVDILDSHIRARSADLLEECGEQLTPVYPQVAPGVAAFVASPTWMAEANLVVVLLDARAIRGHVFAVVLSFPTTVHEINRVAGFSSVASHDVFAAGQSDPLAEDCEVSLPTGTLIRMLPVGSRPLWAAPLAFALWHPHYWPSTVVVPRTRDSASALVLHSSGKFHFDRFCGDAWLNQNGIAALIGIPLAEIRMQAADPAEMLSYVYRGSPVRGVIAVTERRPDRDEQGRALPHIVFLDSRPLGYDLNFVTCDQPFLTIAWLLQYLQQPPPSGWKLVVKGGRRQEDRVDFDPGEVLVLALQRLAERDDEHPESESGFSPDPEQDDDEDSEEDGHGSDSSTRSRSRGHKTAERASSEDRSYKGFQTPPKSNAHPLNQQSCQMCQHVGAVPADCSVCVTLVAPQSCVATRRCEVHSTIQFLQCLKLDASVADRSCAPALGLRVPDFTGSGLSLAATNGGMGQGDHLPSPMLDIGDRSPRRPDAPGFFTAPPDQEPIAVLPTVRTRFVLMIEGYRPEVVPLTLPVPCDIALALHELQVYRLPDIKRLFPRLVPVPHQPAVGFAVCLATTRWPKPEVEVVLDCRSFSGQMQAAFLPPVVNTALLRARAGIAWWRQVAVWTEPYARPIQEDEAVRLFQGSVVVFLDPEAPAPYPGDLMTMLRNAECWDHSEPLPFLFDPALWIMTDEGAFRLATEGGRPRRFVLVHILQYDPARLVAVAPEPPIRNFCDQGAVTEAIIVVSQNVPVNRAPGNGACIVFIDQRPILSGVTWRLIPNGLFSMGRYAAELPRGVRKGTSLPLLVLFLYQTQTCFELRTPRA